MSDSNIIWFSDYMIGDKVDYANTIRLYTNYGATKGTENTNELIMVAPLLENFPFVGSNQWTSAKQFWLSVFASSLKNSTIEMKKLASQYESNMTNSKSALSGQAITPMADLLKEYSGSSFEHPSTVLTATYYSDNENSLPWYGKKINLREYSQLLMKTLIGNVHLSSDKGFNVIQEAPLNYAASADQRAGDAKQGTLVMAFGENTYINNLIVTNVAIQPSRYITNLNDFHSITVNVTLEPNRAITSDEINEWING